MARILDAALSLCNFFQLVEIFSQPFFDSPALLGELIGFDVSHQLKQLPSLVCIPMIEINIFFMSDLFRSKQEGFAISRGRTDFPWEKACQTQRFAISRENKTDKTVS